MDIAVDRRAPEESPLGSITLLSVLSCAFIIACSSAPAPLSITLEHPETKHSLVCAAKDKLGRTDESALAGVVENCARTLEARGYVRQK